MPDSIPTADPAQREPTVTDSLLKTIAIAGTLFLGFWAGVETERQRIQELARNHDWGEWDWKHQRLEWHDHSPLDEALFQGQNTRREHDDN